MHKCTKNGLVWALQRLTTMVERKTALGNKSTLKLFSSTVFPWQKPSYIFKFPLKPVARHFLQKELFSILIFLLRLNMNAFNQWVIRVRFFTPQLFHYPLVWKKIQEKKSRRRLSNSSMDGQDWHFLSLGILRTGETFQDQNNAQKIHFKSLKHKLKFKDRKELTCHCCKSHRNCTTLVINLLEL